MNDDTNGGGYVPPWRWQRPEAGCVADPEHRDRFHLYDTATDLAVCNPSVGLAEGEKPGECDLDLLCPACIEATRGRK